MPRLYLAATLFLCASRIFSAQDAELSRGDLESILPEQAPGEVS
jgi:hypothetical protein